MKVSRYTNAIGWLLVLLVLILWSYAACAQTKLDTPVSVGTTPPATARQWLDRLQTEYGFQLAYSESYLDLNQSVNLRKTNPTLREVLDAIGQATGTIHQVRGNQIIFRKKDAKFTISGYIRDASSGEDLIGANVWQCPSGLLASQSKVTLGTGSNRYGFYSLTLPADTVHLRCSYVGHATQAVTVALYQDTIINWNLTDEMLAEIMITSTSVSPLEDSSLDLPIPPTELLKTPVLLGEVDLLKSLQRLPGVQSGVDGGANLYVRGSGPDHNLLLLDGVPLYNASHLLGLFSVFNADAVNSIDFYRGDFPARYGGRLASVMDVQLREGNREQFQGAGSVGLLSSRLTLEGPLGSNKTSFLLSGRYAHLGLYLWALGKADPVSMGGTSYNFYDVSAKINHTLSHRNQLYLSAYLGEDYYRYEFRPPELVEPDENSTSFSSFGSTSGEDIRWGNLTTAFRWNHVYHRRLFSNVSLTYGQYHFRFNEKSESVVNRSGLVSTSFSDKTRRSGIQDWAGRIDYDYRPSPYHHLRFGGGATYRTFRPGSVDLRYRFNEGPTADTAYDVSPISGAEAELFIEDEIKLSPALTTNVGFRYTAFGVRQAIYSVAQPRLSVRYQPSPATVWTAAYARLGQFMHLMANPSLNLPMDLWLPTTERLPPEISQQWTVGYRRTLGGSYEVQAEAYYKDLQNVVEFKEGLFNFYEELPDWEDRIARGQGRSYGVELQAQRTTGRVTGWLGYAFARSTRQFGEINDGQWFPFRYDRPHEIDFGGVFHWKEHIDVAWGWGFSSGLAVTLPEVVFTEKIPEYEPDFGYADYWGDLFLVYGARNQHRTRPIHRLDVSISFRKSKRWGERTWEFGLYNLYSRRNPFFIGTSYRYDNGDLAGYEFFQRSLLPIVPSVSYRFKF